MDDRQCVTHCGRIFMDMELFERSSVLPQGGVVQEGVSTSRQDRIEL